MSIFTPQEMSDLRAPFPLDKHIVREGHSEGGKVRWFVYIDRSAVQDRLDEMFPGEWETTEPKMYPVETRTIKDDGSIETSHEMSATMGISIRGLTRWDGGESDDGSTKSAITNAFRRTAAYGWGIARYLYDMDTKIKTDGYRFKDTDGKWKPDWNKYDKVKKEAQDQFTQWYNRMFGPSVVSKNGAQSNEKAVSSDLAQAAGDFQARTPKQALNGNGAPAKGEKKRIGDQPPKEGDLQNFQVTSVKVVFKDGQPRYALNATNNAVIWAYSRDVFRGMGYPESVIEDWGAKEQTIPFEQKMPLSAEWKLYKTGKEPRGGYWAAKFEDVEPLPVSEEPF